MDELSRFSINPLNPYVPVLVGRRMVWLTDSARLMGIYLLAGRGSGKSRLLGRVIAWQDFVRGVPLLVVDPNGQTIANFIDKLTRLPRAYQEQLWCRVRYVDMAGVDGYVVPWSLYYRLGDETLYQISQRYLDAIKRVDPWLQSASVLGWNAVWRSGTYAGMVLSALGMQITELESLLAEPEAWEERFSQALSLYPEVAPAVDFFQTQYQHWRKNERDSRTDAFRTKAALLTLDPLTRAMVGAERPGIDWGEVVAHGGAVLLDFRRVLSRELRCFLMLWVFLSFLDFIKERGPGRHQPVSLIIDELTGLYNLEGMGVDLFTSDMDELINVVSRNYGVWLTLAHQELFQVPEKTRKTLFTLGTHIIGTTSDPEAARVLSRLYHPYDPFKVKRYEPSYMNSPVGSMVIDERPIEYTIEEQEILNSYAFRSTGPFQFWVRTARREGDARGKLRTLSIANLDSGQWVNELLVDEARRLLMAQSGVSVDTTLSHIQSRLLPQLRISQPTKPGVVTGIADDTIKEYDHPSPVSIPTEDEELIREEIPSPSANPRDW